MLIATYVSSCCLGCPRRQLPSWDAVEELDLELRREVRGGGVPRFVPEFDHARTCPC